MTFAEKLLKKRRQLGLSQEELAEKLGVSRQAVSRWENGTAMPDAAKLLALSDLTGVPTDALLRDEADIDAAAPVSPPPFEPKRRHPLRMAGIAIAVIAIIGALTIGICASLYPVNFGTVMEIGPDGIETPVPQPTGMEAFLFAHHLQWLFQLCNLAIPLGIILAIIPYFMRKRQK